MGKTDKKQEREYTVPAVDRALDILEFMSENPRPYGTTELSRELNIPVNSVFRIMKRLTERNYTVQDDDSGGYRLSTMVFTLGMRLYTRFELRLRARPHLEWLCRETLETVQIQVPHGEKMLVVDTVSPEVEFYLSVVPGSLVYYHPNAYGKAVLAFMKEEEVKKNLPTRLPGLTPNTIVMRTELISHLAETRKVGLAYDDEEYTSGIFCIGAPVFDVEGKPIAGLGTTCLLSTVDKNKKVLFEQLVMECAYRVSKDIGYTGDFFNDKIRSGSDQFAR